MSYETRAYDNEHGNPVVVLVATGTHDVSRLVNLLAGSRMALCEHMDLSGRIRRQVNRRNGGREALKLLAAHGGPDLLESPSAPSAEDEHTIRVRVAKEARIAAKELTDPTERAILKWFADRVVAGGRADQAEAAEDSTPATSPEPGSEVPGQPGYVVGICGHRVAGSEWRAGFRTCERCPDKGTVEGVPGDA